MARQSLRTSKKPMILNRDAIRSCNDLKRELVNVPEWGGDVYVRELSVAELQGYLMMMREGQSDISNIDTSKMDIAKTMTKLVIYCVVDEDGNRLFTMDDAEWLEGKSVKALKRVASVAQRLSGMGEEDSKN